MLHRREEERAEPPALAPRGDDVVLLEEAREKVLREVLCLLGVVPAPPHERVQRVPVRLAQPLHRRPAMIRPLPRREDHAPARGQKPRTGTACMIRPCARDRPHDPQDTEVSASLLILFPPT